MRKLAVVPKFENKEMADSEILKLAVRMMDSMRIGDYTPRSVIEGWGGVDLYPGGRVMRVERSSAKYNIEICLIGAARVYRVTYCLLETRK